MADKKGTSEAIRRREQSQAACHHETYIHPPTFPGAHTVKACRLCGREQQIKERP